MLSLHGIACVEVFAKKYKNNEHAAKVLMSFFRNECEHFFIHYTGCELCGYVQPNVDWEKTAKDLEYCLTLTKQRFETIRVDVLLEAANECRLARSSLSTLELADHFAKMATRKPTKEITDSEIDSAIKFCRQLIMIRTDKNGNQEIDDKNLILALESPQDITPIE